MRYHVVAEMIDNTEIYKKLVGELIISDFVQNIMEAFKNKKSIPSIDLVIDLLQENFGINIYEELLKRLEYINNIHDIKLPKKYVHIIGSTRSGTSHIFNLLAYQGCFAYFTNLSHQNWFAHNLKNNRDKIIFEHLDKNCLTENSKIMRLKNNLIIPSESENIWNMSFKCYKHLVGHSYEIFQKCKCNYLDNFKKNVSDHCNFFDRSLFLSKSPFNSFCMDEIQALDPENTYFIHIIRNGISIPLSMEENNFLFKKENNANFLTSDEAWVFYIESVLKKAKKNFLIKTIKLEDFLDDTNKVLNDIFEWLNIKCKIILTNEIGDNWKKRAKRRSDECNKKFSDNFVKINKTLGYKLQYK